MATSQTTLGDIARLTDGELARLVADLNDDELHVQVRLFTREGDDRTVSRLLSAIEPSRRASIEHHRRLRPSEVGAMQITTRAKLVRLVG